jgi:UDP-2,4-diacetamido-2,4,6-trideoxy-beta-L-altropyranose hydrolase
VIDQPVILRADAGRAIGTGHLMRTLALAEGYRGRDVPVILLTATSESGLLERFLELGVTIYTVPAPCPEAADRARLVELAGATRPSWIVIDGYHFNDDYLREAGATGSRVLLMDDMAHLPHYQVDIIVNQNAHASLLTYPAASETRVLRGVEYVLLRGEFRATPPSPRPAGDVAHVLITLGGADPHRATEVIVASLADVLRRRRTLRATIAVGAANPRASEIRRAADSAGPRLEVVVGARDMRELMARADIAISGAGTTVWELAYMGVPSLLVESGEAERMLLGGLASVELFEAIGRAHELDVRTVTRKLEARMDDADWRGSMSELGMRLVDGRGVDRVLDATIGAAA